MKSLDPSLISEADDEKAVLSQLYGKYLEQHPEDQYLAEHQKDAFLVGTIEVFRFYLPYVQSSNVILDWGCRHAPDSCLLRHSLGSAVKLYGCDVYQDQYDIFRQFASLEYAQLKEPYRLPYANEEFDAVIASGVLEHVPFDYESLKEIYRILKPGGRLILTYLPNRSSLGEWYLRRRKLPSHTRLYRQSQIIDLLLHTGFRPIKIGYQDRIELLPGRSRAYRLNGLAFRILRPILRLAQLHRISSCHCGVAEKVRSF